MKITAFIAAYNEADIIGWTIGHLVSQGVEVYFIDNHSTDDTLDVAKEHKLAGWERFPAEPSQFFELTRIDTRIGDLAHQSGADWCILCDADEIRRSTVSGESLHDAIRRIDGAGYTIINHQVVNFHPVDNGYRGDPEHYFRHYAIDNQYTQDSTGKRTYLTGGRIQFKAWRCHPGLRPMHGGHVVSFPAMSIPGMLLAPSRDIRISPEMFLLKHYPIRSQQHGERKVFEWRRPRWYAPERAKAMHIQYDGIEMGHNFLGDPEKLSYWPNPVWTVPFAVEPCCGEELKGIRKRFRF